MPALPSRAQHEHHWYGESGEEEGGVQWIHLYTSDDVVSPGVKKKTFTPGMIALDKGLVGRNLPRFRAFGPY